MVKRTERQIVMSEKELPERYVLLTDLYEHDTPEYRRITRDSSYGVIPSFKLASSGRIYVDPDDAVKLLQQQTDNAPKDGVASVVDGFSTDNRDLATIISLLCTICDELKNMNSKWT